MRYTKEFLFAFSFCFFFIEIFSCAMFCNVNFFVRLNKSSIKRKNGLCALFLRNIRYMPKISNFRFSSLFRRRNEKKCSPGRPGPRTRVRWCQEELVPHLRLTLSSVSVRRVRPDTRNYPNLRVIHRRLSIHCPHKNYKLKQIHSFVFNIQKIGYYFARCNWHNAS